jgi:methylenetetrahydrofolate dehydrogenase (NADP+)/methenyltetrahydrofolate cyclohydrolase
MKIIDGKKIADHILLELKKEIETKKLKPCLAIILVGNDSASCLYIQKKEEAAQKIGLKIRRYDLAEQGSEKEILDLIESLNRDKQVNGILVQLPLPDHLTADKIVQAINPAKDVDGFIRGSQFESPFILAIWQALVATGQELKDKKIVALVNSDIFGQALKLYLKGLQIDYLIGFKTEFLKDLKKADIIITALGQSEVIKGPMIKQGTILIDGGVSRENNRLVGDVDRKSIEEKADWLAPVPSGVGPLTVAFLLKNVVLACEVRPQRPDLKLKLNL